ncbi:MAG: DNA polymerase I [Actinomycetes bacterium]
MAAVIGGKKEVDRPRLLLLDGHSLAYRAFYALPVENFATSTGQPTNAVYGFTSMLINALRDEQPTHVAVAFDVSRKTFRSEVFPDYKATRKASPEGFAGQVDLIRQVLSAMGIPFAQIDGMEADDILATWATAAATEGAVVSIISGDRDVFQLVTDDVTVLYPRKGMSDLARMTPGAIEEKYGLTPAQYPDFAALRGDPSDNLPGIPGVGEKTATKWIATYGSLAGLVEHVDEMGGKVGDALRHCLPQVLVNRQLTSLRLDVAVDIAPLDIPVPTTVSAELDAVFDALQFRALRDRLNDVLTPAAVAPSVEVMFDRMSSGDMKELCVQLREVDVPVSLAFAGQWGAGTGSLTAIALDWPGIQPRVVSLDEVSAATLAPLWEWLADAARPKYAYDVKGPLLAFHALGKRLAGVECDVALAAYVLAPGTRWDGLGGLCERYLQRSLDVALDTGDQLELVVDDSSSLRGLAAQALAVSELAAVMLPVLAERRSLSLLTDVEIPTSEVLAEMEFVGIAADDQQLRSLSTDFGESMSSAEATAYEIVGRPFNLGSPKQLQGILFDERSLPKTKKIKTGFTTDADALKGLYETTSDPLLEQILAWRDAAKLRQTVDGLLPLLDSAGRIHTTFQQTTTATGRLSSSDPNLQNIPIRTEEGRRIRGCFVVGQDFHTLLTADYSQIEMRIMAHLCQDPALQAAFAAGEDLHTTVAAQVFGVDPADVDAEMRRRIKAMSYGLAYGLSAYGLSQQLSIGVDEARRLMEEYFTRFGGVRDYLTSVVDEARVRGYTETMLGRRRYLPDLTSDNRQRRDMAERMALNAPIQGSAADIMKVAMIDVAAGLSSANLRSRLLLQVHDELVIEVADGELDSVREIVVGRMSAAVELSLPLEVSVGVGRSWQSAGH